MNFDLSDEQRLLEETVDKFLATECGMPRVRELFDGESGFDEAVWRGLGEMGVLGLPLPEDVGGAGLELLELAVVAEVMGRRATPGPFSEHVLAAMAIDRAGTDDQRQRWLPGLARWSSCSLSTPSSHRRSRWARSPWPGMRMLLRTLILKR